MCRKENAAELNVYSERAPNLSGLLRSGRTFLTTFLFERFVKKLKKHDSDVLVSNTHGKAVISCIILRSPCVCVCVAIKQGFSIHSFYLVFYPSAVQTLDSPAVQLRAENSLKMTENFSLNVQSWFFCPASFHSRPVLICSYSYDLSMVHLARHSIQWSNLVVFYSCRIIVSVQVSVLCVLGGVLVCLISDPHSLSRTSVIAVTSNLVNVNVGFDPSCCLVCTEPVCRRVHQDWTPTEPDRNVIQILRSLLQKVRYLWKQYQLQ